jgi:hypothetical protein
VAAALRLIRQYFARIPAAASILMATLGHPGLENSRAAVAAEAFRKLCGI